MCAVTLLRVTINYIDGTADNNIFSADLRRKL